MFNVEDLFYKPNGETAIEGYLGEEAKEDCKILFVLREPHDSKPMVFWFKEIIRKVENAIEKGIETETLLQECLDKYEKKYFLSLGTLA